MALKTICASPTSLEEIDVARGVDGVPQFGVLPLGQVVLAVGRRGRSRGHRRRGPLQLSNLTFISFSTNVKGGLQSQSGANLKNMSSRLPEDTSWCFVFSGKTYWRSVSGTTSHKKHYSYVPAEC